MQLTFTSLLVGCHFANKTARLAKQEAIHAEWKVTTRKAHRRSSKAHYQNTIDLTAKEHMSSVDCFDGKEARSGTVADEIELADEDLVTVSPVVDGRMKDEGRHT